MKSRRPPAYANRPFTLYSLLRSYIRFTRQLPVREGCQRDRVSRVVARIRSVQSIHAVLPEMLPASEKRKLHAEHRKFRAKPVLILQPANVLEVREYVAASIEELDGRKSRPILSVPRIARKQLECRLRKQH